MKFKLTLQRSKDIATWSVVFVPAIAMIAPILIPFQALAILGIAHAFDGKDEIEVELSFNQWLKVIQTQHWNEEEKKRWASLYWQQRYKVRRSLGIDETNVLK